MNKNLLQFSLPVLELPRLVKQIFVVLVDICLCVLTVWFSFF